MEIAMTKMSQNGQIVIPLEIRKEAKIKPSAKFMVMSEGGNIMLKLVSEEIFKEEMKIMKIIARSEKQIREGKYTVVDTSMSTEEIDKMLRKKEKNGK
jgi:bifunctional DNA-binding transcriptional regulator/antitoxin component of YhaV-PrlF toxin-antitoxin module